MDNRHFNTAEQGIKENTKEAIKKTLKELEPKFIEVNNARLHNEAVDKRHSAVDNQNNNANNNLLNNVNNQSQSNDRQRVLTRPAPMKVPNMINREQESSYGNQNANRGIYQGVTSDDNPFDSIRNGGSINANTILIVIASLVIVVMLVIICLTIMSNFGIRL